MPSTWPSGSRPPPRPGEILIGDATYRLARDAIRAESVGPLMLKGKEETVEAHRLLEVLPGVLSHTRRFDSPMVGRGRELQSLADAFERAGAERSCHLFTVLGAAGVGKSRLVREALAGIGDRARLLVGTCLPYGEGITFWPALEVVKQGTGIDDGDSPRAGAGEDRGDARRRRDREPRRESGSPRSSASRRRARPRSRASGASASWSRRWRANVRR